MILCIAATCQPQIFLYLLRFVYSDSVMDLGGVGGTYLATSPPGDIFFNGWLKPPLTPLILADDVKFSLRV